jgi:hypothetical protein
VGGCVQRFAPEISLLCDKCGRLLLAESGLSDFLDVSDATQAEFAKIPIAGVFLGAIQK